MSKKRRDESQGAGSLDSEMEEAAPAAESEELVAEPEGPAKPETLMTFDRWFTSTGRPAHHKAGMLAFIGKMKGKRAASVWEQLFKAY